MWKYLCKMKMLSIASDQAQVPGPQRLELLLLAFIALFAILFKVAMPIYSTKLLFCEVQQSK